jgi:hypothetical protein
VKLLLRVFKAYVYVLAVIIPAFAQTTPDVPSWRSGAPQITQTVDVKNDFGCVGDGVADDTQCIQHALDAANGKYLTLGPYLYAISGPLSTANTVIIVGSQLAAGIYSSSCVSGFTAKTVNLNLLTLTGSNSSISRVCFQMGSAFDGNSSGAALKFGVGTMFSAINNQFNFCFVCIDVTGSGNKQNVSTRIVRNVFQSPSDQGAGVRVGFSSIAGDTVSTRVYDNECWAAVPNTAACILFLDAGGAFMRGNSPFQMGIGTKIFPGHGQTVSYLFAEDIMGDTSYVSDLLIDSNGGTVSLLNFNGVWTSGAGGSSGKSVRIMNSGGGALDNIKFTASRFVLQSGATVGVSVEAGNAVGLFSSTFCSNTNLPNASLLAVGGHAARVTIQGNDFSACGGVPGTGISIASGASFLNVRGNNIGTPTIAISYIPAGETATIGDNVGVDNLSATVVSASKLVLPLHSMVLISGNTTVTSIAGTWSNRTVTIVATDPTGVKIAGGANSTCANATLNQFVPMRLTWISSLGCWVAR